jgi:cell division protein FtsA
MAGRSVDKSVDGRGAAGRAPVVAALDLGQSKVGCFIMKPEGVRHADRTIRVAGAGHVQSRGIKGGGIISMDEAAQAIGHAVERAERAAGSPVSGVVVTTAIGQMASHRVQSRVSLSQNPVGDADLARAIGMALAQIRLPNRRPIHVLPIAWSVDGARGVHDPRSMRGGSLGLDLLVVSMAESAFASLSHCLELAHLDLQGVAAAPVAYPRSRPSRRTRWTLGCVCIDMGGGSTSRRGLERARSLLHIESRQRRRRSCHRRHRPRPVDVARRGPSGSRPCTARPWPAANEDREMLEAPPRGEDPAAGPVIVPRAMLKTVIAPRVEETLELLRDRLRNAGVALDPGAEHRPDRRRQPTERRARAGDSGVRPPGASGQARSARPTWPTPRRARPSVPRPRAFCFAPPTARARPSRRAS